MRYEGMLFRPPSEANSYILQATIGCSWNKCTYCVMYQDKQYRVRDLNESLEDLRAASNVMGSRVDKIFVADGDALAMPMDHWLSILENSKNLFPRLKQVSCYALASNIMDKGVEKLEELHRHGLSLLYIGPESGDDATLKRIAKGSTKDEHVEAAKMAHRAGLQISIIAMLGVAGTERSQQHAEATADLVTQMDPEYFAALTTSIIPGSPIHKLQERGKFELPSVQGMLKELRTMVDRSNPTDALFRTNHASNYLPLAGRLPADRERIVSVIDSALEGKVKLRPEWSRGL